MPPAAKRPAVHSAATALLSFRAAITADPSGTLAGWTQGTPLCSWRGVTCNSGRVVSLELPRMGLTGILPGELAGLSYLRKL